MRQQQNDPIAQAMQILQFVTQRRGQQADIQQGSRRLDLQEQQLQQGNQQFNQGLQWEQTKVNQQNEQWQAEQDYKQVQQALENAARERQAGSTMNYQDAIAAKMRAELSGQIKDPQMLQAQLDEDRMIVASLQEQLSLAPAMEQGRIRDQLQAYLAQRYKDKLPPLRDYNQAELNAQQMFQTPQQ